MLFIGLCVMGGLVSGLFTIGCIKVLQAIDEIYDDYTRERNNGLDDFI